MGYKTELQSNNTDLQTILNTINAMEGGSQVESTFVPTDSGVSGYKGDLADNNVDLQRILELVMSLPDIPEDITIENYPSTTSSLTYTGSAQSPSWSNYDSTMLTIGGTTSATDAGRYTATFTPNDGYVWPDGSTTAYSVSWSIGKATLTVPSQSGSLTYSGSAKSPSWSNYDSSKMTIGGTTSGTNAGTYTATFTPKSNYQWSDGSTSAKSVSWSIAKASGSVTLSKTSITLDAGSSTTFTVTRSGNGTISVKSSSTSVATVSVSGTTVTVKGVASGSATITVSVAAGTNHLATSKTCSVTVSTPTVTVVNNGAEVYYNNASKTGTFTVKAGETITVCATSIFEEDGSTHLEPETSYIYLNGSVVDAVAGGTTGYDYTIPSNISKVTIDYEPYEQETYYTYHYWENVYIETS